MADLYHVMIAMFLNPGTVDQAGFLFSGQAGLQVRGSSSRGDV
jgi:V-type H+-transporting ATPase subunit a